MNSAPRRVHAGTWLARHRPHCSLTIGHRESRIVQVVLQECSQYLLGFTPYPADHLDTGRLHKLFDLLGNAATNEHVHVVAGERSGPALR